MRDYYIAFSVRFLAGNVFVQKKRTNINNKRVKQQELGSLRIILAIFLGVYAHKKWAYPFSKKVSSRFFSSFFALRQIRHQALLLQNS